MLEENRLDKLPAAIETGYDDGMQDFNRALFQLVQDGKISKEEALSKAGNPQALEMNFKGIFLSQGSRILGYLDLNTEHVTEIPSHSEILAGRLRHATAWFSGILF